MNKKFFKNMEVEKMKNTLIVSFAVCIVVFSSTIALAVYTPDDLTMDVDGSTTAGPTKTFSPDGPPADFTPPTSEPLNLYTYTVTRNIRYNKDGRRSSWDTKSSTYQHYDEDGGGWKWMNTTSHVTVSAWDNVGNPTSMVAVTTNAAGETTTDTTEIHYSQGRKVWEKTVSVDENGDSTTQITDNIQYNNAGQASSMDITITAKDGTVTTISRHDMRYNNQGQLVYYQDDINNTDGTHSATETYIAYYSDNTVKEEHTYGRKTGTPGDTETPGSQESAGNGGKTVSAQGGGLNVPTTTGLAAMVENVKYWEKQVGLAEKVGRSDVAAYCQKAMEFWYNRFTDYKKDHKIDVYTMDKLKDLGPDPRDKEYWGLFWNHDK